MYHMVEMVQGHGAYTNGASRESIHKWQIGINYAANKNESRWQTCNGHTYAAERWISEGGQVVGGLCE